MLTDTDKTINSFRDLPDKPPYGFVVYEDGKFGIVMHWAGHDDIAGGTDGMTKVISIGGIRMALSEYGETRYEAEYLPRRATQRAKKTTNDLADYYQLPVKFENASWMGITEGGNLIEGYPEGWNKEEFERINDFVGKLRYANTHLAKIASGSGRSVFRIDENRVLKVAKNRKGLAQNAVEADPYLQNYDVVARVYDRGGEVKGVGPFWVEAQFCKKVSAKRFEQLTGVTIDAIGWYMQERHWQQLRGKNYIPIMPVAQQKELDNNEFVVDLQSLNADYDMSTGDQGRLSTYGEIIDEHGKPKIVLVDYGLTSSVWNDFYKVH